MSAAMPWGFGGECHLHLSSGMCNIMGCSVVRVMGLDGAQAPVLLWVDVLHPLSPVSVAPEIQPGPEEVKVLVNGSVVLPCQAEGWPMPQVTWHKDGRLLPLRGSNRYKALWVGGTKSRSSNRATLHIKRCFGIPPLAQQMCALLSLPRLQLLPGGSLQIDSVQVQDSGSYLCMASSPAGSDRRGLDLHILGKQSQVDPSWARPPAA